MSMFFSHLVSSLFLLAHDDFRPRSAFVDLSRHYCNSGVCGIGHSIDHFRRGGRNRQRVENGDSNGICLLPVRILHHICDLHAHQANARKADTANRQSFAVAVDSDNARRSSVRRSRFEFASNCIWLASVSVCSTNLCTSRSRTSSRPCQATAAPQPPPSEFDLLKLSQY